MGSNGVSARPFPQIMLNLISGQNDMATAQFERSEHVYKNDEFAEIVKDAVRFFNGTPVHQLPPPARFRGTVSMRCITQGAQAFTTNMVF